MKTTWQIGRRAERIAQAWLFANFGLRTESYTIKKPNLGTTRVDLYDANNSHVYEVKAGRRGAGDYVAGQAFHLSRLTQAGAIRGATFISVEHKGKLGFTPLLQANLRRKGFGMYCLKVIRENGVSRISEVSSNHVPS